MCRFFFFFFPTFKLALLCTYAINGIVLTQILALANSIGLDKKRIWCVMSLSILFMSYQDDEVRMKTL